MSEHSPVYYGADAVRRVLTWPLVNGAVESALKAVVKDQGSPSPGSFAIQPKRIMTNCGDRSRILFTMPAFVGNYSLASEETSSRSTLACKLVTSFRGNPQKKPPLPSVQAHVLLFNSETGELSAIMEGTDLTTWRTAAASVLATKYLYFRRFGSQAEMDKEINVAIVGCGVQGQIHAISFCANFRVKQMTLYNRTESKARDLAEKLKQEMDSKKQTTIVVCSSPGEACEDADVICIATYSREGLIHAKDLKKSSVHINSVGAGEVHFGEVAADVYHQAKVYVDCHANAEAELKGLPAPIQGEVGAVILNGSYPAEAGISIFQSMGMASEDACVAQAVQNAILQQSS
ncbi:ketimine reductase mu-crystallin [Drosophila serrata]|uniref:ketimine reductase mu-crystallin n=1 Tax=Drosophila serrata TaxID=7274 RepID=UPI000A1D2C50|nr:ketimine reductase mu-crystallin [Drosophila serrata]